MLKFEDIKVGDVLDIDADQNEKVIAKTEQHVILSNPRGSEEAFDEDEFNSIDAVTYHQPKPTKESIIKDILADLVWIREDTFSEVVNYISELPKDKIKTLFDLGE
jgi:hypothetical protein